MVHVPYRSGGQVLNDLIAGRIAFYYGPFDRGAAADPRRHGAADRGADREAHQAAAGRPDRPSSRASASTSAAPGRSIVVPAKTPQAIIEKVNADITAVVNDPGFRAKLEEQGAEFLSASPAEAQAFLVKENNLGSRW